MFATPTAQSSAPAFSLATLRDVLADMEQEHPEYGLRPVHAATIVAVRRIEANASGTYWVQSECDPTREYWVCPLPEFHLWRCTCQDYQRRGGPCKHALAVQIFLECERRGSPPPPIPFPARTLSDDEPIPYVLTDKALAALDAPPTTAA